MFADLNGARLHYEVSGTGEPVILIGGFGTNAAFWEHARTLLDGYRVVTYDNRGVGQTSCADGYSERDMAEDAIALMDHLGMEKAHVLGWSMGSHLGQIIGAEHPDRVRSLTLVSTYLRLPSRSLYILEGLTSMAVREEAPTGCLAMAVNAFCYPESLFRRFADEGRDISIPEKLEDPGGLMGQLRAMRGSDTTDVAPMVRVPTLIVHGSKDIMVEPEEGSRVADAIPGCRFVRIEDVGHDIPFDSYVDVFRGFVDSHRRLTSGRRRRGRPLSSRGCPP